MLPRAGRARSVQAAARREQRADHHADRPRRGARQGAGPRARCGRLHNEAVLDPRVPSRARLLRRAATSAAMRDRQEVIEQGDVRIDLPRRAVEVRGEAVQLTFIEFEMLALLGPRAPASSSRAASSSSACAAVPTTGSRARSTSTCATSARRSSGDRATRSSSSRSGAPATASDPSEAPGRHPGSDRARPRGDRRRSARHRVPDRRPVSGATSMRGCPSSRSSPSARDSLPSRFEWPETVERFDVATNTRVVAFDVVSRTPAPLAPADSVPRAVGERGRSPTTVSRGAPSRRARSSAAGPSPTCRTTQTSPCRKART